MIIGPIKVGKFFIYRGHEIDRCNFASSPNLSRDKIDELAADPSAIVRIRLAHRDDLSDTAIQILLNDSDRNVRFAILSNEKIEIPEDWLGKIANNEHEEEFIRKTAQQRLKEGIYEEPIFLQFFCLRIKKIRKIIMADKVLKHFFILNFLFSALIVAMVFVYGAAAGLGLPLAIIFSGLVKSFFIKENKLFGYTKSAVIISSVFSVFLIAGFSIYLYFIGEKFWLGYSIYDLVTGFIIIFSFLSFLNLAGALIGIVPKAVAERISSGYNNFSNLKTRKAD